MYFLVAETKYDIIEHSPGHLVATASTNQCFYLLMLMLMLMLMTSRLNYLSLLLKEANCLDCFTDGIGTSQVPGTQEHGALLVAQACAWAPLRCKLYLNSNSHVCLCSA